MVLNQIWLSQIQIKSLFAEDFYRVNDNIDIFAALRFDDHPNWGSHLSPRIGGFYDINQQHLFRLTWQTGFRGAVGVQFAGGFVQDGFLAQDNFASVNKIATTNADFDWDGDASNDSKTLNTVVPETIESLELSYSYNGDNLIVSSVVFFNTLEDILAAEAHSYNGLGYGDQVGTDDIGTWNGNWYYQNQSGKLAQWGSEVEVEYAVNNFVLSASHAHVAVTNADPGVLGVYVLEGDKSAAYPSNVTRLHAKYSTKSAYGNWSIHYNHLYYWEYDAPTGVSVDGNHLANVGLKWSSSDKDKGIQAELILKNVFNNTELYPINGTGNLIGGDGAPTVEERTWWLGLSYGF